MPTTDETPRPQRPSALQTARRIAWGTVALALVGLGGALVWQKLNPPQLGPQQAQTALARPAIGGPFALTDPQGRTVTNDTLKGKPFAIFFGFTRCPDVCPTTLNDLSLLYSQLGEEARNLNIVFVSVDPEEDRPEDIGQYLTLFDAPIIGLTGTQEQLQAVTRAYRVVYEKVPLDDGGASYTIDHTATVFLMDADGNFAGTIDMHEPRETGLEKLKRLVSQPAAS